MVQEEKNVESNKKVHEHINLQKFEGPSVPGRHIAFMFGSMHKRIAKYKCDKN